MPRTKHRNRNAEVDFKGEKRSDATEGDCMGVENPGPSLTSEGRIHSIGRTTFPSVDYFSVLLAVCGDWTSSQGACYEAMNTGILLRLPVVFVHQSNQVVVPIGLGCPA
jgi:hypothetical protein